MENEKIYMEIHKNGKLVSTFNDSKFLIIRLFGDIYNKQILKVKNTIKSNYNYDDIQTIKVIDKVYNSDGSVDKWEYIYYNIPTKCGYLDVYKINELMKEEGE